MQKKQIRWHQRLQNYSRAQERLRSAVAISQERKLNELEEQGVIQAFEFTHELAWNVMKDYFFDQGNSSITGSKDATREAFQKGLILDGDAWMDMIRSRNLSSHTYNEEVATEIVKKVTGTYFQLFDSFLVKMTSLQSKS